MASQNALAPHELLELHEIMRSEVVATKKLQTSMHIIRDSELKSFMQDSLSAKKAALDELEQLYIKAQNNRLQ